MLIEREKKQHVKIGERTVITTSNVYISTNTRFAITTGSQDLRYNNNVSKKKKKQKKDTKSPHYIPQKKKKI